VARTPAVAPVPREPTAAPGRVPLTIRTCPVGLAHKSCS
jgi:hypothetical protein